MVEPANCTTTSTITTKTLSAVLGMNTAKTLATIKFTPAEGSTLATVKVEGESCPISGTYKVTGTQFAQAKNATGVFAVSQTISTSAAIQESAGTATSLKFGENAATLTGELKAKLAGEPEWAGKES